MQHDEARKLAKKAAFNVYEDQRALGVPAIRARYLAERAYNAAFAMALILNHDTER